MAMSDVLCEDAFVERNSGRRDSMEGGYDSSKINDKECKNGRLYDQRLEVDPVLL